MLTGDELTELRLALIERQAEARLALGLAAQAVPDLQAHISGHPWREEAWRLLALALYRSGRQAEALDAIDRAKSLLAAELGLDPGLPLVTLEADILRQAARLEASAEDVLAVTAAAYARTAPASTRTRLESAATLAGSLALTGGSGLQAAMSQRLAAIDASEKLGDPELTARVIGNFDAPAIWTRSDDPAAAARIVAAAERTLAALPPGRDSLRARLLATIALESRGDPGSRPGQMAAEAEVIARHLGDPALLAFTLNMHSAAVRHRDQGCWQRLSGASLPGPPLPSTTAPAPPRHKMRCCPRRQRSPEQPAACLPQALSASTSLNFNTSCRW